MPPSQQGQVPAQPLATPSQPTPNPINPAAPETPVSPQVMVTPQATPPTSAPMPTPTLMPTSTSEPASQVAVDTAAAPTPAAPVQETAAAPPLASPAMPTSSPWISAGDPPKLQQPLSDPSPITSQPEAEPQPSPQPSMEQAPAEPGSRLAAPPVQILGQQGQAVQPSQTLTPPGSVASDPTAQPVEVRVQSSTAAGQPGAYETVRKAGLVGMIGGGVGFFLAFGAMLTANYNFVIMLPVALAVIGASALLYRGGSMKLMLLLVKVLLVTVGIAVLYSLLRGGYLALLGGGVLYFLYKASTDLYKDGLTTSPKFWEAQPK